VRNSGEFLDDLPHSRCQVRRSQRSRRKLRYSESDIAWLFVPAKVQQFRKSCALEQIAGGTSDPGLEFCPKVGGGLDVSVDLLLGRSAEPRHRQVGDMFRFDMLDDRPIGGIGDHRYAVFAGQECVEISGLDPSRIGDDTQNVLTTRKTIYVRSRVSHPADSARSRDERPVAFDQQARVVLNCTLCYQRQER
jgi:hypothetical protein